MAGTGNGRLLQTEAASYASDVGVLGILQAVSRLRGLILLPVIAGLMGTAAYGVWTQSLLVVAMGSAVIGMQLPAALVRFVSGGQTRKEQRSIVMPQLVVLFVIGAGVAFAAALVPQGLASVLFGDAKYAPIAGWLGLWVALATIGGFGLDLQRGLHYVKRYGLLTTAQVIVQLVVVAVVILLTRQLKAAVLAAIFLEGVVAFAVLGLGLREVGLAWPGMGGLRGSLAFCLPLVPSYYGGVILNMADRLLIAWRLGPEAVGIYSAAYGLARVVAEIFRPIKAALVPAASRLWDRAATGQSERLLTHTLRYYLMLAIPAVAGVALLGPAFLALLARQVPPESIRWIVPWLSLGFLLSNLQSVFSVLLQLGKDTRPLAISKTLSAAAYVAMVAVAVPRWGLIGGAVSTSIGYCLDLIITFSLAWRRLRLPLPIMSTLRAMLATVGMTLVVLVIRGDGLPAILLGIASGAATYTLLLAALGGVGRKELAFFWSIVRPGPQAEYRELN